MRSFTDPPGLKYSTLASTGRRAGRRCTRLQPDQRGVADQVDERFAVAHGGTLRIVGAGCPAIDATGRPTA